MDQTQFERLHELMSRMIGHEYANHPAHDISALFQLNNLLFAHEYSQSCGGCRQRVYNQLKDWYLNNKHTYGY